VWDKRRECIWKKNPPGFEKSKSLLSQSSREGSTRILSDYTNQNHGGRRKKTKTKNFSDVSERKDGTKRRGTRAGKGQGRERSFHHLQRSESVCLMGQEQETNVASNSRQAAKNFRKGEENRDCNPRERWKKQKLLLEEERERAEKDSKTTRTPEYAHTEEGGRTTAYSALVQTIPTGRKSGTFSR